MEHRAACVLVVNMNNNWFISDLHFNHYWINKMGEERGVILFERTQFADIKSHDDYIVRQLLNWAKDHEGHTLWILGDFGDITYLWVIDELHHRYNITCNFICGNHDKKSDIEKFECYFDNVYKHPVYITDRVILSHEPIYPCAEGCVNVHGHLHAAVLDSPQHLNASIHVINYQPFSWKKVAGKLGKISKVSYKFLQEPYADKYIFTQDKKDVVYDSITRKIDIEKSRALQQCIKNQERQRRENGRVN